MRFGAYGPMGRSLQEMTKSFGEKILAEDGSFTLVITEKIQNSAG
jgi:hypothetical protein